MTEASNDLRYRVLENWCLAHTGEKNNLEQATENLAQILEDFVRNRSVSFSCTLFSKIPCRKTMSVHSVHSVNVLSV